MSKPHSDRSCSAQPMRPGPPPLDAGIRRHLGLSLRTFYAGILSEPPGARIEALLARLRQSAR